MIRSNCIIVVLVVFVAVSFIGIADGADRRGVRNPVGGPMDIEQGPGGMPGMGMPGMGMPGGQVGRGSNTAIGKALNEMLGLVNAGQEPDKKKLLAIRKTMLANRPKVKQSSKEDLCQFYMLDAWVNYFAGDMNKALQNSMQCVKVDPGNNDAKRTQAAIYILADKGKGLTGLNRVASPTTQQNKRGGYGGRSNSGDVLDLDVGAIKPGMIGDRIGSLNSTCINSTEFSYNANESSLCVLFWQLKKKSDGSESEPNDLEKKQAQQQQRGSQRQAMPGMYMPGMMPDMPGMPGMGGGYGGRRNGGDVDPFTEQTMAFGELFAEQYGNGSVKFLGINTDSLSNSRVVVNKLLDNPWPWAQVIAEAPGSKMPQFAGMTVDTKKPFMVIANRTGTIKYAGPASGFLSRMMLNKFADKKLEAVDSAKGSGRMLSTPKQVERTSPKEQKQPVQQPVRQQSRRPESQTEITAEEFQAQKMVENAKMFVKAGTKLGSAKKGVDLCREVIAKYPNTDSADKARELLRNMPERYQKRYGVTNEEMGL